MSDHACGMSGFNGWVDYVAFASAMSLFALLSVTGAVFVAVFAVNVWRTDDGWGRWFVVPLAMMSVLLLAVGLWPASSAICVWGAM